MRHPGKDILMADKMNLTLLTDFYELTMANGYFEAGMKDDIAYFDCFFRNVPDDGGFAIFAGLNEIIEYMEDLKFTEEDIEFLRRKGGMSEEFLEYLKDFKFTDVKTAAENICWEKVPVVEL